MCPFDGRPAWLRPHQAHSDMNAANDQYAFFCLNLAGYLGSQSAVARVDFARFQSASKSAYHSTGRRSDNVIDRRGVRPPQRGGIDLVMLRNSPVHAEYHWLRFTGQMSNAEGALAAFDFRF